MRSQPGTGLREAGDPGRRNRSARTLRKMAGKKEAMGVGLL